MYILLILTTYELPCVSILYFIYSLYIYVLTKSALEIINKMLLLEGKENDHIYEYSRKLFIPHPKISLMYQPAVGRKQELFSPKENIDNSSKCNFMSSCKLMFNICNFSI